jgi:hypothetical protein
MDGLSNPPGISFQAKTSAQQPISTPYERYHQKVSNIVGHRWQRYLEEHPAAVGDVTILVLLETSGKVASISVIANHSADDLAALSTRAILESDIPPVPADLVPMLKNGKLKMSFIFNVYDPRKYSPSGQTIQPLQN